MEKPKKAREKKISKNESEKVCEVFEVEKAGEEKIVTSCGGEPVKHADKKDIEQENKILRNVLIGIGLIVAVFLGIYLYSYYQTHYSFQGVKFDKIKQGELTFYHTTFPVSQNGRAVTYNAYLRTNTDVLAKVPFEGNLTVMDKMVINSTKDFNCDGDGIIAVANLAQIFGAVGSKAVKDDNASCDPQGRYTFVRMQESDYTGVIQTGPACYDINIKDCEVLPATERLILEMMVIMHEHYERTGLSF